VQARGLLVSPSINADNLKRVFEHLERAIKLDPDYALAYSALAMAHIFDYSNGWLGNDPETVFAKAVEAATRAVEIDPNEPETQGILSVIARLSKDVVTALACVDKALSVNPNHPLALFTRGVIATYSGRPADGIADFERIIRVDPSFSHQTLQYLGTAHLFLGNYETAALVFKERLLLVKNTDVGRVMLAAALGHLGDVAQARKVWQDLMEINPDYSFDGHIKRMGLPGFSDYDRVTEGLAKAGLPL